ncbi:uncharacterized protein LOC101854616 isoform X2 [Aplysia californica]|nr:uncharacterized protein LOC101854616 isoform X2 [Aplysia californica]XP_005112408.1 uncharacterized protein LOC101854616 isoform X2 [Aplysia californica]
METSCKSLVHETQGMLRDHHMEATSTAIEEGNSLHVLELPDSIFLHIFEYLPFSSVGALARVCRRWRCISSDELLWREVFLRHYKLPKTTVMPAKACSWRSEFKRLHYHTPVLLTEERKEHKDEVLHISFSHNGTMFATCSKDGFFKVWECTHPCRLLFKMDMKNTFSWKFTQFSQFNETDTCLLVSGVYFGRFSTSGEIAVFNLQDDFRMQCRVTNKPYDVFGAWYDNDHLLSGTLYWTSVLNSVSAVWLSKASQEVESEMESVSMMLYRFENVNSSSIRLLHVAEVHKDEENVDQSGDNDGMDLSCDGGSVKTEGGRRVAQGGGGAAPSCLYKGSGEARSFLDRLLSKTIAEDEFDLENEDKTDDEEEVGVDTERVEENVEEYRDVKRVEQGVRRGVFGELTGPQASRVITGGDDKARAVGREEILGQNMDCDVSSSRLLKRKDGDLPAHCNQLYYPESAGVTKSVFESLNSGAAANTASSPASVSCDNQQAEWPSTSQSVSSAQSDNNFPSSTVRHYSCDGPAQVFQQQQRGVNNDCSSVCESAQRRTRSSSLFDEQMEVCVEDSDHESSFSAGATNDTVSTQSNMAGETQRLREQADFCDRKCEASSFSDRDRVTQFSDDVNGTNSFATPSHPIFQVPNSVPYSGGHPHHTAAVSSDLENLDEINNNNSGSADMNAHSCQVRAEAVSRAIYRTNCGPNAAASSSSSTTAACGVASGSASVTLLPGAVSSSNPVDAQGVNSVATQTAPPARRARSPRSHAHAGPSSSLSRELARAPREKLLIYTWGSETYIPHKIGIKRMLWSDFNKGEVTARSSSMLLPDVMENLHNSAGDRRDKPDVTIEMHGHIVGLSLSPDQRFLYVNCRPWPKNYIISDPQESPPLAQEVEISSIDLTTFEFVGPVLRSHRAYTHSDECFFLNLDVSDDFVVSGAEDRQGYLWDRHYGISLYKFPHMNVVNCVAVNPKDPEVIITVSDDHTFKVWRSRSWMRKILNSEK